jgi:uncharacterized membrane protein YbhN (UPF0104 family)
MTISVSKLLFFFMLVGFFLFCCVLMLLFDFLFWFIKLRIRRRYDDDYQDTFMRPAEIFNCFLFTLFGMMLIYFVFWFLAFHNGLGVIFE